MLCPCKKLIGFPRHTHTGQAGFLPIAGDLLLNSAQGWTIQPIRRAFPRRPLSNEYKSASRILRKCLQEFVHFSGCFPPWRDYSVSLVDVTALPWTWSTALGAWDLRGSDPDSRAQYRSSIIHYLTHHLRKCKAKYTSAFIGKHKIV